MSTPPSSSTRSDTLLPCPALFRAQGLPIAGLAGAGGAAAGSAERPSVLFPRPPRRSLEGVLARRPGRVPVHQAAGAGALQLAEPSRWGGDDLGGDRKSPHLNTRH